MSQEPKRPYERPTLEAKEIFGAEGVAATCCKATTATCSGAAKTGTNKGARTSSVS
jgi:hypothetical protein